jgi:hypothetical protein
MPKHNICFLRVRMAKVEEGSNGVAEAEGIALVLPDLGDTLEVGKCTIGQDTLMAKLVSEIQDMN